MKINAQFNSVENSSNPIPHTQLCCDFLESEYISGVK